MPLLPAKRSEVTPEEGLRGGSDEEDGGCGIDGSRKKLRLSKDQSAVLEDSFREHPTLNPVSSIVLSPAARARDSSIIPDEQLAVQPQSFASRKQASSGSSPSNQSCLMACSGRRQPWRSSSACGPGRWRCGSRTDAPGIIIIYVGTHMRYVLIIIR